MIWVYRLLFLPLFLLMLPRYLWRMIKRGGYARDFRQRLGFAPALSKPPAGVKRIWLQAVSVGEILAVEPLVRELSSTGGMEIVITTTTSTGYALARERLSPHVRAIGLFPLDFWLFSAMAWRRLKPDMVLLMEGELWPEHLHQAGRRGVPALLVNARLSDRSFRRYKRLGWIKGLTFDGLTRILASTPQDHARFSQVAGPERVVLAGHLKCDIEISPRLGEKEIWEVRQELGFQSEGARSAPMVLLGSSTWPGEEEALLAAFKEVLVAGVDCRLLLVPRHAERRDAIIQLLERQSLAWHARSRGKQAPHQVMIYLGDTTGELRKFTQVADLVFVGKSLAPHTEGQTPIEAAVLGKPLMFGPGMSNFKDISRALVSAHAARTVEDPHELAKVSIELLKNSQTRGDMARAAVEWHQQNRGALLRVKQEIAAVLSVTRA